MAETEDAKFMKGLTETNSVFEDQWLTRLSRFLDKAVGKEIREKVMRGSEKLATAADPQEVIRWTQDAMARLDALVVPEDARKVMAGCACRFPERHLLPVRERYTETKDIDEAYRLLLETFRSNLRDGLKLDEKLIEDIVSRGWGVAGVRKGDTIVAVKMPFQLREYLGATDPQEKRYYYCHCPRVRQILKTPEQKLSSTYCYCGAGFYQYIWEQILQQPVEVEVMQTVLEGADDCRIAVRLRKGRT